MGFGERSKVRYEAIASLYISSLDLIAFFADAVSVEIYRRYVRYRFAWTVNARNTNNKSEGSSPWVCGDDFLEFGLFSRRHVKNMCESRMLMPTQIGVMDSARPFVNGGFNSAGTMAESSIASTTL
jgi:hypothetical protein